MKIKSPKKLIEVNQIKVHQKSYTMNRRSFLFSAASLCLTGCSGLRVGRQDAYSVVLIGDTHFDATDPLHYHAAYRSDTTEHRFKAHKAEHVRNAEMWRERLPRLLAAAGACRRPDAAFVLQMGDLVQGDCGDAAVHRQMLEDAVRAVKKPFPDLPFVTVCGNHDIRGTGAQVAYNRYMPGVISRELGVPVARTTFSFRQGPDVFIVADFNVKETTEPGEDYARILNLLDESRDARHTFLVTHGPFIASIRWSLLGSKTRDAERRELTRRLAARNAIVLAGHTHVMEFDASAYPEGRLTQVVVNSVWTPDRPASLALAHDRPEQFGGNLKALAPKARRSREALIAERVNALRRHWQSRAAGWAQLVVSDAGVSVEFHVNDALASARRETLA